jgi:hypothetical protein
VLVADRRSEHFEVHARRGGRWTIELTAAEEAEACARARLLLQRAEVESVKVWKEVYDPRTDQAAGRVVLAETRPRPKGRWRFARWTAPPPEMLPAEPAAHVRRNAAAPPPLPRDWPVVACSIGGGCLALIALAALAALGEWAPLD